MIKSAAFSGFLILITLLLCQCSNSRPDTLDTQETIATYDTTIASEAIEPGVVQSAENNADTLPVPKKIKVRNRPAPNPKVIEMPKPGVSERDKREIDSIKAARNKINK